MKEPLTQQEMNDLAERVAFARAVCRKGKMPSPRDIDEEKKLMYYDSVRGVRVMPNMSRTEAATWLGSNSLDVPALEEKGGDPILVTTNVGGNPPVVR